MINWIEKNRVLLIIILSGIFLRLIIMPITLYVDILSATFREYLLVDTGIFRLSNLQELILSGYLYLVKPHITLVPETINNLKTQLDSQLFKDAISSIDIFAKSPKAMRTLFILKFPFLIIEISSILIVLKLFKKKLDRIWLFAFWWLNPIIIYGVYAWGRYEIIPILFILISIYFVRNKKTFWSFLFLGLAIVCREVYIFILPIYLIYFYQNWYLSLLNIVYSYLPNVVFIKLFSILRHLPNTQAGLQVSSLSYSKSIDYVLDPLIGSGSLAIAPVFIIILIFYWQFYKKKDKNFKSLVNYSTIIIFIFLILTRIHPHYMVWLIPLLSISFVYNRKIIYFFLLFVLFYFLYFDAYFGSNVTLAMFKPLDFELFSNIGSITDQLINQKRENLLIIFRTFYLIFSSLIIYLIYYSEKYKSKN